MTIKDITKKLRLMASLMELHEANPFKVRAYTSTIIAIERLGQSIFSFSAEEMAKAGITKGMVPRIMEILESGTLGELEQLREDTPAGVQEMLNLKGIGAKKVRTIWKELGVHSIKSLKDACQQHKVSELKGFGEKTEKQILEQLKYLEATAHLLHYSEAEEKALALKSHLEEQLPEATEITLAGYLARQMEVIGALELLVAHEDFAAVRKALEEIDELEASPKQSGPFTWAGKTADGLMVLVHLTTPDRVGSAKVLRNSSPAHLAFAPEKQRISEAAYGTRFSAEGDLYKSMKLATIPAPMREGSFELALAQKDELPTLVQESDLKGVLHNHSTYSDGQNTLEEMARHAQELGYDYLGITDHSKSAFYANGLNEQRIIEQHQEIDELNEKMAPFRIFKGIESDILSDGSLDYSDEVLGSFDFIVSSIHSNLKMDEEKATNRLLRAIENPYTSILGHPTGRLLLKREGYPINHQQVIDACAKHGVAIEINANPWRLDLDWRWVRYALDQGVKIAINPDAHKKEGYADMRYGLLVGQKAGLTADMTLNAMGTDELEAFFQNQKK